MIVQRTISREQSLFDVRTADRVGERSVLEAKKVGMRAVRQQKTGRGFFG